MEGELAAAKGALKGSIFQDLLAALREAGASHAQVDLSFRERSGSVAELLGLNLSEWASLQGQADALRNLVRIKVADDNDLKAANLALQTCSDFFGGLTLAISCRKGTRSPVTVSRRIMRTPAVMLSTLSPSESRTSSER